MVTSLAVSLTVGVAFLGCGGIGSLVAKGVVGPIVNDGVWLAVPWRFPGFRDLQPAGPVSSRCSILAGLRPSTGFSCSWRGILITFSSAASVERMRSDFTAERTNSPPGGRIMDRYA